MTKLTPICLNSQHSGPSAAAFYPSNPICKAGAVTAFAGANRRL